MKVETYYHKRASGQVAVNLLIAGRGDYPTTAVFNDDQDWPNKGDYVLGCKQTSTIIGVFKNAYDAQFWAAEQVDCLKEQLNVWREIKTPDDESFEI